MTTGRVEGKVALITGAGRGQGRSHALKLAEEGADIIAVDICSDMSTVPYPLATEDDLAETVRLVEAMDRRIIARAADVRDFDALQDVVKEGISSLGRLDVVCANAGVVSPGPSWELSEEAWNETIDVCLTGIWRTAKAVIPHMIETETRGSLIFTGSSAALVPPPNISHYSSAKAGVVALSKALAQELSQHFIRVNTVHPTAVNSGMIHNEPIYRLFCPDIDSPTVEDVAPIFQAGNSMPVAFIDPIDVSEVVLFLASDAARYVTGASITVDAGNTIKYPGT